MDNYMGRNNWQNNRSGMVHCYRKNEADRRIWFKEQCTYDYGIIVLVGTTIKEVVGGDTEVVYELNPTSETLSGQDFSLAIGPYVETGSDDPELKIKFNGGELASSVADKVPTLVILVTGRPLVIEPSLLEKIQGLVVAWLPGTQGREITDVIYGDYPFEGRLPMTWFRSVDQLPVHAGENSADPLFPFGFGLTS